MYSPVICCSYHRHKYGTKNEYKSLVSWKEEKKNLKGNKSCATVAYCLLPGVWVVEIVQHPGRITWLCLHVNFLKKIVTTTTTILIMTTITIMPTTTKINMVHWWQTGETLVNMVSLFRYINLNLSPDSTTSTYLHMSTHRQQIRHHHHQRWPYPSTMTINIHDHHDD